MRRRKQKKFPSKEIIFVVEEDAEGGFVAKALDTAIVTQAEKLPALRRQVRDAVNCHFPPAERPQVIRLHFVRDEVFHV